MPPLVLVLDVGSVRPLDDRQPDRVVAGSYGIGHVELGGKVRILADAQLATVELDDQDALRRADVQDDAATGP